VPYRWTKKIDEAPDITGALSSEADGQCPMAELELWPHQSLTGHGFVWFIAPTALLFAFPLLAVLGTPVLWVLLLFCAFAIGGVWFAIKVNRRHRHIQEKLTLWADKAILQHRKVGENPLIWEANPYWVEIEMIKTGGPVDNYLTLRGSDRTVEIGSFLSGEERVDLNRELIAAFAAVRRLAPLED